MQKHESKMDLKIDEEILKKTTRCKKNFSCLSGERSLCNIELCVNEKIHFIKCVSGESCNYRIPFGYSFVCTCPVRKELHKRYGI